MYFEIEYYGRKEYKLVIYNRLGQLIFESNDRNYYWDGKVRNATYKLVLGGYGLGKEELVCTTHYLSAMEYQKWGHARSDRDYALGGFRIA